MPQDKPYPIGTPGVPWGNTERRAWRDQQKIRRSYAEDVVQKIEKIQSSLNAQLVLEKYGALHYGQEDYPVYLWRTRNLRDQLPTILITGGVHGYETSGVHGALSFVQHNLMAYQANYNFIVAPCISPWAYETINRWNPDANDPNRCFYTGGPALESTLIMKYVQQYQPNILAHIDLHETTDTDNSEFRPALAARDAIEQKAWDIPDGFYCVGNTLNPQPDFQKAIIDSVQKVTHIAPADKDGKLIGVTIEQHGVINYPKKKLGLCAGFTSANYVTTTEVYPDSAKVTEEECNQAQVAAIAGALDYLIANTSVTEP